MDQKKIGAFIARRRKELDMTQKELAEKLGDHGPCGIEMGNPGALCRICLCCSLLVMY